VPFLKHLALVDIRARRSQVARHGRAPGLSLRDLTDPSAGSHAIQLLLRDLREALAKSSPTHIVEYRGPRVVSVADNYDALRFPPETVTRDARYTHYVDATHVLRTHTSAMIPRLLRDLAQTLAPDDDVLVLAPGIVYRRDCIDRLHTGQPHQVDVWRVRRRALDLQELVATVVSAVLPGREHRTTPTEHPYTTHGLQIDVRDGDAWIEIGECGHAHPDLLPAGANGLAMGLGLDRLVMLRKGISDVRMLRATDPRIASQMIDLTPYRPVTVMPSTTRDMSIAVAKDASAEELGDRVRSLVGDELVEEVQIVSETDGERLPAVARARLGMREGQKNVLVRVVLSAHDRTLTRDEANRLRDEVYAALHEGDVHVWACGPPAEKLR